MDAAVLKERIENGEYHVDPKAVADAMLLRLRLLVQNECSYPTNGSSASGKTTPAGP